MSMLEEGTTKKGGIDKNVIELDVGNSKKYKVKTICDIAAMQKIQN